MSLDVAPGGVEQAAVAKVPTVRDDHVAHPATGDGLDGGDVPTSLEALLIVAFGIVPGFVFFRGLNAVVPLTERDPPREVLMSVAASMVFWTLAASPLQLAFTRFPDPTGQAVVLFTAALVAIAIPVGLGYWTGKRIASAKLGRFLGMRPLPPTAWDYRFGRAEPLIVRVMLNDGTQLLGYWASDSYASGHPASEDLYLEGVYELDDELAPVGPQPATAGAWIPRDSIKFLQFTHPHEEPGSEPGEGSAPQ